MTVILLLSMAFSVLSMRKISASCNCAHTRPSIDFLASAINQDGYYKGIKLCGRVKVVEHFADIKVKVVDSFPDLKVKVVESFPDDIGEWKFVESGEDFTVQFVDSFPDIKIKYVNSFPGVE
ncbi:hypothetical protein [Selenomonas ruminantium]|nr:hypothetical protein [Selenomonas ruminantium]